MAVDFSYVITAVRVADIDGLTDAVREVEVRLVGVDGAASYALPYTLKLPQPDAESFTPFAVLTEAQIVGWVQAEPTLDARKAQVEAVLAREVERLALQPRPLPWIPPSQPAVVPMDLADPEE